MGRFMREIQRPLRSADELKALDCYKWTNRELRVAIADVHNKTFTEEDQAFAREEAERRAARWAEKRFTEHPFWKGYL